MDKGPAELFVGSLIGNRVMDGNGASLGRIEELVIDARTGRVKSVVLSMGDLPAYGNAACAIPWEALKLEPHPASPEEARVEPDNQANSGKPDRNESFSVYTYPVSRWH